MRDVQSSDSADVVVAFDRYWTEVVVCLWYAVERRLEMLRGVVARVKCCTMAEAGRTRRRTSISHDHVDGYRGPLENYQAVADKLCGEDREVLDLFLGRLRCLDKCYGALRVVWCRVS